MKREKKVCGACEHYGVLEQFRGMKVSGLCKNVEDSREFDKSFIVVSSTDICDKFVNKAERIRVVQKKLFDMGALEVLIF